MHCCIIVTAFSQKIDMFARSAEGRMFEVHLNLKQDRLLVIAKGQAIPVIENAGHWRKKRVTATVSNEIKRTIQRDGFYCRRLRSRDWQPSNTTTSPSAARQISGSEIANYQADAHCRYRYHDHKARSLSKRSSGDLTSASRVTAAMLLGNSAQAFEKLGR